MANKFYGSIGTSGGSDGFLDNIDGSSLADGDGSILISTGDNTSGLYAIDADSAAAQVIPTIMQPDTNGGDKRWILKGTKMTGIDLYEPGTTNLFQFSQSSGDLTMDNTFDGGAIHFKGEDSGDKSMAIMDPTGGVTLYYTGTIEASTISGALKATNALDIAGTTQVSSILDEDTLVSDSATALATQQSIKAYVDKTTENLIINGDFRVNQRSATYTSATTPANDDDTYLLDRWVLLSDGDDIVDVSQGSSGGVDGNSNYIRLDVETAQKKFGIFQIIENLNLNRAIGSNVSLSFDAVVSDSAKLSDIRAVVLSWDSTADTVTSDCIDAWGAEGANPTLVANWTAENTAADLGVTQSWARYTIADIDIDTASTTNIGLFIYQNNVATNDTVTETLDITNVQVVCGAVAGTYAPVSMGQSMLDCERYYEKSYDQGVYPGAAEADGAHSATAIDVAPSGPKFAVVKRDVPTVVVYDAAGTSGQLTNVTDTTTPAASASGVGQSAVRIVVTTAPAGAAARMHFHWTASAEL